MSAVRELYKDVAVYDPSTYDVVYVDTFLPPQAISVTEDYFQTGAGTERVRRRQHELVVPLADLSSVYQIYDWSENETDVNAVLIGAERHVQWYENSIVQILPNRQEEAGNLSSELLRLFNQKTNASVHHYVNLLWHLGFEDTGGDGLADGYTATGENTVSFSGTTQTIDLDVGGTGEVTFGTTVDLPIEGIGLTFAVDWQLLHTDADDNMRIRYYNSGDSLLGTDASAVSGAGVETVTGTTPANTAYVEVECFWDNGTGIAQSTAFSLPTLRTDGRQEIARY